MARDLGTKYTCFKCGTKFYDLKKPVPTCPKCGADQREAPVAKPTSSRARPAPAKEPEEVELPAGDDEEAEEEEEAEDDDVE